MFPVKFGNESDIELYSSTLRNGEKQLLITEVGNIFLTVGDGTYIECSGRELARQLLELKTNVEENYVLKTDVTSHANVVVNDGKLHTTMPLQQAVDYIMSKLNVLDTHKVGSFKAGTHTCGFGVISQTATCGTFKAGTLVCGRGILPKTICGTFKVGEQKCGS